MLDFAHPYYLFFLLTIPVVWLVYVFYRASLRHKIKKFGRPEIVRSLMPDVSHYKPAVKLTICLIALAMIVIALARPRFGEKEEMASAQGSEIVIAFDVSRSMLAPSTDDPASMARIERARMLLEKLISTELGNDKVGLVVFAANARMQMPLTSDKRIIQMAMQNDLSPGMMANQGTSLSEAIEMSMLTFPGLREQLQGKSKGDVEEDGIHRAIILITDAEDHEGDAVKMAEQTARKGIQIDVIGVGSAQGGKIPLGNGSYLTDSQGQEVVTKLNDEAAASIAQAGGGVYVNAADPNALDVLRQSLDKLKKSEFETVTYKMNAEQFPLFAWIAVIFLLLDLLILDKKTILLRGISFFNSGSHKPAKKQSKTRRFSLFGKNMKAKK